MEAESLKILVIFTGGTIGSTINGEYISSDENKPYVILEQFNKRFPNSIEWETKSPYTILSENATVETYRLLAASVKEGLGKNFDGIIITHGSDTLQYSAAFLSLILGTDTIPVLLVSSNYVLEDERANGMDNFAAAVDFICNGYGRGVFVPYKNTDENVKIHCGEKLMPHNLYSDYLYSLDNKFYGEYGENGFYFNNVLREDIKPFKEPDYSINDTEIYSVYARPGNVYPNQIEGIKKVLLHAYHGGTFCVEDEKFKKFIEKLKHKGIPVYLIGGNPETDYDSCRSYEKMGIEVMGHISPIYAYMKLWVN